MSLVSVLTSLTAEQVNVSGSFSCFRPMIKVVFSPSFKGSPFFLHLKVTPSVLVKKQVKVTSLSEQVNFTEGLETFSGEKQNGRHQCL